MRTRGWLGALVLLAGVCMGAWPATAGEVWIPIGPGGSGITAEVKSIKELQEEGIVQQRLDFTCGATSVATIFTYFLNLPCTEGEVIQYILTRSKEDREAVLRRGFTLLDLKQFALSKGVQASGYRMTFGQLQSVDVPVLLPIIVGPNTRHFVVFLGAREDQVFLADPATGRRTIPRILFEQLWDLKIGMVFKKPNMPLLDDTVLAIRPFDETTIPSGSVLSLALPTFQFYYFAVKEF